MIAMTVYVIILGCFVIGLICWCKDLANTIAKLEADMNLTWRNEINSLEQRQYIWSPLDTPEPVPHTNMANCNIRVPMTDTIYSILDYLNLRIRKTPATCSLYVAVKKEEDNESSNI